MSQLYYKNYASLQNLHTIEIMYQMSLEQIIKMLLCYTKIFVELILI